MPVPVGVDADTAEVGAAGITVSRSRAAARARSTARRFRCGHAADVATSVARSGPDAPPRTAGEPPRVVRSGPSRRTAGHRTGAAIRTRIAALVPPQTRGTEEIGMGPGGAAWPHARTRNRAGEVDRLWDRTGDWPERFLLAERTLPAGAIGAVYGARVAGGDLWLDWLEAVHSCNSRFHRVHAVACHCRGPALLRKYRWGFIS